VDFVSAVRSDVLRPVLTYLIPGAFALGPYLLVTAYYIPAVPRFWNEHSTAFGLIVTLIVIFVGAVIEDVGTRIELLWDRRLIRDGRDNWQDYLKLHTQDEVVGQRYLRGVLMRLKFELSMVVALPIMGAGLTWINYLYQFSSWLSFAFIVIAVAIAEGYLAWESFQSARLLHGTRQLVIDAVRSGQQTT